jgi:hypothetical protein
MKKILADFNNADTKGRLRLNLFGGLKRIKDQNIELQENLEVLLDDDEGLRTKGIVQFSNEENIWVALIDWNNIEHY